MELTVSYREFHEHCVTLRFMFQSGPLFYVYPTKDRMQVVQNDREPVNTDNT